MELEQARKRAAELRAVIEKNNRLYYDQDAPELEDYEYDQLTRELKTIEAQFPQLVTPDSPTQHVGGTPSGKFSKVAHAVKMESLQDAFSLDELREFDQRVREAGVTPEYVVEIKIDGLSVSLEYRNGRLTRGSTRGDGLVGEDVTENLATIKSIPKEIPNAPDFLEVRGEVYMPHEAFFALKEQQELEDKTPFKNPRNAAAGSLRQKDAKITAARGLSIFVFNLQQVEGKTFTTHSETLDYIKSLGFPVSPRYNVYTNIEDAIAEIQRIGEARGTLDFDMDGAVIKVNDLTARQALGSTNKFPRWAIAFKYPPEVKESTVRDIEVTVGRTGVLTPTAVFDPIFWRVPAFPAPTCTMRISSKRWTSVLAIPSRCAKRGILSRKSSVWRATAKTQCRTICRGSARPAGHRWYTCRMKPPCGASTRNARPRACATSSILPPALPWPLTAWAKQSPSS